MRASKALRPSFLSARDAVELVPDRATVAIEASGGGVVEPASLIDALGERFAEASAPSGITLLFCSGVGDREGSGVDRLTAPGLVRRVVGGHYGMSPTLAAMADRGDVEAYNFPQGVIAQLYRAIASGRPGVVSQIGLETFVDPRLDGGRLNDVTTEELVEVVELRGSEWLLYRSFPIDVAFIRATTADAAGNLTMEREAARLSVMSAASAARTSGGIVIAQVERTVDEGELDPHRVVVPGHLVDHVVVVPDQRQTVLRSYNPAFSGEETVELADVGLPERLERRIVGRRAHAELEAGAVVNLGVGMADAVAAIAAHEGTLDKLTLTVEQGITGGMPASGVEFGAVWNPEAIVDQHLQFDFYDGGGLDAACLGFAQIDRTGNVNVSRIDGRIFGVGGFVNISQSAATVVFCGSLTSGGLAVSTAEGRLSIDHEGRHRKFVDRVSHLTFSADRARRTGQRVLYVTERAVFELTATGVRLTEVAPGIDIERDVLALMDFEPEIPTTPRQMDAEYLR